MMPYSMKEHPEHEGAPMLTRSARVATQAEWERLCRESPGKILWAMAETLPDGPALIQNLINCARANGASISNSQSGFRMMPKPNP